MPCYLFTFHAFGTWMPDREEGFVRRERGILPPDEELARQYRDRAKENEVIFDSRLQALLIITKHRLYLKPLHNPAWYRQQ